VVAAEVVPETLLLALGARVAAETAQDSPLRLRQRQAPQILAAVAVALMVVLVQQEAPG